MDGRHNDSRPDDRCGDPKRPGRWLHALKPLPHRQQDQGQHGHDKPRRGRERPRRSDSPGRGRCARTIRRSSCSIRKRGAPRLPAPATTGTTPRRVPHPGYRPPEPATCGARPSPGSSPEPGPAPRSASGMPGWPPNPRQVPGPERGPRGQTAPAATAPPSRCPIRQLGHHVVRQRARGRQSRAHSGNHRRHPTARTDGAQQAVCQAENHGARQKRDRLQPDDGAREVARDPPDNGEHGGEDDGVLPVERFPGKTGDAVLAGCGKRSARDGINPVVVVGSEVRCGKRHGVHDQGRDRRSRQARSGANGISACPCRICI